MRSIVIHKAKDLRIEEQAVETLGPDDVEVRVAAGGICGSDLHYYHNGGFGTVRLIEPMVLGHEVAGTITKVGDAVTMVRPGARVAVNPSRPCGACAYCLEGLPNHCLDMRFYGSAMRVPHVQGAFREVLVASASQCVTVPSEVSFNAAAFGEPLAVCLHAMTRAGPLLGKKVLITGSGPIGALALLAARRAGALEIVSTDVLDQPLARAREVGADDTINVAAAPERLAAFAKDKGYFDVMFEASGNEAAIRAGLDALRPRGIMVQLGLGGEATLPMNLLVAKEIEWRGTFRFHAEFRWAVELITKGLIDVAPLLSDVFPVAQATEAFEAASDRSRSMKVQISFE